MGNTNAGNEELVFLANAIKEGRKRRLKMQLALNNLAARRRRVLNLACLVLLLISHRNVTVPRPVRSCRRLKRNSGWWENVCNTYSDVRFKKTFRVSRGTFNFILRRIEPFLIRQTVTEEPIPPALRLAICLYRLSRGYYFYTIAEMSGLGVSTISSICQEVCQVLVAIYGTRMCQVTCPKLKKSLNKKFSTWKNSGNFHAVGQHWMAAIFL